MSSDGSTRTIRRCGAYTIELTIFDDYDARVYVRDDTYYTRERWFCRVQSPPWWMFWVHTIPEAIAKAAEAIERRQEQDRIKRQARRDAEEMAAEIAKMFHE